MTPNQRHKRRAFLRGLGTVAVGLPLLDIFARNKARADEAEVPRYVVFMRHANGVCQANSTEPEAFWPSQLGTLTADALRADSDRAISELADYADKLLLVRGTGYGFMGGPCGHQSAVTQLLTASDVALGPDNIPGAFSESVDMRMARALNRTGQEPFSLISAHAGGACLSYRAPFQRQPAEASPWTAYKRMMGLGVGGTDDAVVAQIAARRRSVNDLVREQMQGLLARTDLSRDDRQRLDQHFSAIRDIEVKLACKLPRAQPDEIEGADVYAVEHYDTVTHLHIDLIALSFACDYSRVALLQLGQPTDSNEYTIPSFRNGQRLPSYHRISHRVNSDGGPGDPIEGARDMHQAIDRMHARLYRHLLDKLTASVVPGGNLLDRSAAIWVSDLGDGPNHAFKNLPWVIAGGAGGYLKRGVYMDAGDVTHNKLLNTLLNAVGARKADGSLIDDFGDERLPKGIVDSMLA